MTKVKRSTYQKVVEENKRLMKDIEILVKAGFSPDLILCINKWEKNFREKEEREAMHKALAKQYIKDHKDELPDFLTKGIDDERIKI